MPHSSKIKPRISPDRKRSRQEKLLDFKKYPVPQSAIESADAKVFGAGGGIRTHEPLRDRRLRPALPRPCDRRVSLTWLGNSRIPSPFPVPQPGQMQGPNWLSPGPPKSRLRSRLLEKRLIPPRPVPTTAQTRACSSSQDHTCEPGHDHSKEKDKKTQRV
jgi:hypothetical protein